MFHIASIEVCAKTNWLIDSRWTSNILPQRLLLDELEKYRKVQSSSLLTIIYSTLIIRITKEMLTNHQ